MIKKILVVVVCIIIITGCTIPLIMSFKENALAVVVIEGQSNAAYDEIGIDLMNDEVPIPENKVYYYGTKSSPIQPGSTGNLHYDITFKSYGIHSMISGNKWKVGLSDAIIAYEIQKKYDMDVLIINTGIAGSSIQYLLPEDEGGQYIIDVVTHALQDANKIEKVKKTGFVWIQGEADNSTPVNTYVYRFNGIMKMNQDLGFDYGYIVETAYGNAATAQNKICNSNPNMIMSCTATKTFTVENGLLEDDGVHYTAQGRYIVGMDVSEKIKVDVDFNNLLFLIPTVLILAVIVILFRTGGED